MCVFVLVGPEVSVFSRVPAVFQVEYLITQQRPQNATAAVGADESLLLLSSGD